MARGEDTAHHPSRKVDRDAMAYQAALKARLPPMDPRQIAYLQDTAGSREEMYRASFAPDYDPVDDERDYD